MTIESGYGAQVSADLAGFWRRLGALVLDSIIVVVVTWVVAATIAAMAYGTDTAIWTTVRRGLVGFVLGLAYFGFLWARSGQTIGYMALGLRLVRADGSPVTFAQGMLRYAMIYLSFLAWVPALVSAFMVGLGGRKQAIHDLIAGTLVVKA